MNPIESRGPMPPDVKARWEKSLSAINEQTINTQFEKTEAAAAEENFSGFLRRCIHQSGKTLTTLVGESHVDRERLALFLRGEGLLDTAEIDRLLMVLAVELTPSSSSHS